MEIFIQRLGRIIIDSIAGLGTTVTVPALNLSVDLGFLTKPAIRTDIVALTHLHSDHVAGIHGYLGIRNLYKKSRTRFLVPGEVEDVFSRFLTSLDHLQPHGFDWDVSAVRSELPVRLKSGYLLKAFPTVHSVPSLGYAIIHRKLKLRPEFFHLSGKEIAEKRTNGDLKIFENKEDIVLVVTGDTTLRGLLDSPYANRAITLVVETTFLDYRKDIPQAHLGNHIHLDELIPVLKEWVSRKGLPSRIILYHLSQLYKPDEAISIVNSKLPSSLKSRVLVVPPRWPDE